MSKAAVFQMIFFRKTGFISKVMSFYCKLCVFGACRSYKHQISLKLELQVVLSILGAKNQSCSLQELSSTKPL